MIEDFEWFELKPLEKYSAPKYPTYEDAKAKPVLLKKIPARWKRNATALACIGMLGATTLLGGCAPIFRSCGIGCSECGGIHFGGSGVPIYVVYLTEQEAIDVIRNKSEYMGLTLNDNPPDTTVRVGWQNNTEVGLDLFNEEKNIAMSVVHNSDPWGRHGGNAFSIAREAQEAFDEKDDDMITKVLHGGVASLWCSRPGQQMRNGGIEEVQRHLTIQVREFIEWLQAEGIIQ